MATKQKLIKVRVTLEIPVNLIPAGVKNKARALQAIITGALAEFGVRVARVNAKDLR